MAGPDPMPATDMHLLADEGRWPRSLLDADYGARATVSVEFFEACMARYRSMSEQFGAPCRRHADVVYDRPSGQALDIYGTGAGLRPVFVFLHGGYWRMLSRHDSAFMAGMLERHGIATAAVDYELAPKATLAEIVRQVRESVGFLWREGARLGIDPDRIYIGGSSAGGHLAAATAAGGWQRASGVPEDIVKGALPISGLFHLAPIAGSFVQEWLQLDAQSVRALSPIEHLPQRGGPMVVAYAEHEAAGFKRQSEAFHRRWLEAGFESTLLELPSRNHFDVILDLADEHSALGAALLRLIRRERGSVEGAG